MHEGSGYKCFFPKRSYFDDSSLFNSPSENLNSKLYSMLDGLMKVMCETSKSIIQVSPQFSVNNYLIQRKNDQVIYKPPSISVSLLYLL